MPLPPDQLRPIVTMPKARSGFLKDMTLDSFGYGATAGQGFEPNGGIVYLLLRSCGGRIMQRGQSIPWAVEGSAESPADYRYSSSEYYSD
jgi:hypothetical protein